MQTTEELMDRLDRDLRLLRVEFERFSNRAPGVEYPDLERERSRIGAELRRLRNSKFQGVEIGFRLSTLESKYASYSELFRRRVRQLEEGVPLAGRRPARAEVADPDRGVVVAGAVEDETVAALYQGLQRSGGSGPRFDLESFRTYLERQLDAIRTKTGCDRVVFRIAEEDGKMKLKARPVREGG
jgi:hypothetical protein